MKILVVHKRPGETAEVVEIENGRASFQKLLNGARTSSIRVTSEIYCYIDDEGIRKELPINFYFHNQPIAGPAVFSKCNDKGEDVGFQTDEEAIALCCAFTSQTVTELSLSALLKG
jgi:hypothetical protein